MQATSVYLKTSNSYGKLQDEVSSKSRHEAVGFGSQDAQINVSIFGLSPNLAEFLTHLAGLYGWVINENYSLDNFLFYAGQAPSCIIVDVAMLTCEIETIGDILKSTPTSMIFVDSRGRVALTMGSINPGDDGCVTEFNHVELVDAVRRAIHRSVSSSQSQQQIRSLQNRYRSLSRREQEVMLLVTKGLLNKQVAHELKISEVTVKVHRGRMMRKMAARSLAELVRMADDLDVTGPGTAE